MALEIESPHRSIFEIESLSTMVDTPIGLGHRPECKARPRCGLGASAWVPAPGCQRLGACMGAAAAAGWPRLAELTRTLTSSGQPEALALRDASGEPVGRRCDLPLISLVIPTGNHCFACTAGAGSS